MAVGVGSVTLADTGASPITISFTSTSEPLYVIVGYWRNSGTISTVAYGGTGLTRVAQSGISHGDDRAEIWRLLAPAAGTANVVLTTTAGISGKVGIFNTTGQHAGTPEGTAATNASAGDGTATGSLAISAAASGDLTIVGIALGNGAAVAPASTGGSGMTEMYDAVFGGETGEAFRVSNAVTAVSGSWSGGTGWAIAAIPLKSAVQPPASISGATPSWDFPHPPIRVT